MKSVKAAAVQISPVLYSREGTIEKVVKENPRAWRPRGAVRHLPRNNSSVLPILSFKRHCRTSLDPSTESSSIKR
jgi:hypothetical protein